MGPGITQLFHIVHSDHRRSLGQSRIVMYAEFGQKLTRGQWSLSYQGPNLSPNFQILGSNLVEQSLRTNVHLVLLQLHICLTYRKPCADHQKING